MPKLETKTAKLKASRLTNLYVSNGLNQSAVARKEGVTRQAINQRLKHLPVQSELQTALHKIGITTKYKARKFKELLEAKKLQGQAYIKTSDNSVRIATLKLICQVNKDIESDSSSGVKIINIIHAYRKEKDAPTNT